MKLIVIYLIMVLLDAFYISGSVWLVVQKDWSGWTIVGAVFLCGITNPTRFVDALKERP